MVYHNQRWHLPQQIKKGGNMDTGSIFLHEACKRTKPSSTVVLFLFMVTFCSLSYTHWHLGSNFLIPLYEEELKEEVPLRDRVENTPQPCSSIKAGRISCDRNAFRYDICFMKGDVRMHPNSFSITIYTSHSNNTVYKGNGDEEDQIIQRERIKPYTRKWETSIMNTVDELNLSVRNGSPDRSENQCQVHHSVPAIIFSTGGYTGNVYHEFNDGLIPLYITSQHLNRQVVFVILEYHNWWIKKYHDILSHLSDYPPINFNGDKRTHCFSEAIVGLKIHGDLEIDSFQMQRNKSIFDFRKLLDNAYRLRIQSIIQEEHLLKSSATLPSFPPLNEHNKLEKRPKLVVLSRSRSRRILNEKKMIKMAEKIGFHVQILSPNRSTELAKVYRTLNDSDVMVGVHGAAMTHLLFMNPGSVFIQVIPLGTDWAAKTYYGDPAIKLGLKYIPYKVLPKESSLYTIYEKNDPVLRDPNSLNSKGWQVTKKTYLDKQNVRLNLARFRKRLIEAYCSSTTTYRSSHENQQCL